jgi:murein DD-endopeptidase MepM/ murein hydrolase activator NlpD
MSYQKYFFAVAATAIVSSLVFLCSANGQTVPEVDISSDHLMQADTLLVVVKNEPGEITGKLGVLPVHFLRSDDGKDWVAIVGISVGKKPGNYILDIRVAGKEPFKKDITVAKRIFPVTPLVITPALKKKGYTAKKIITTIQKKENVSLASVLSAIDPNAYFHKPFADPLSNIQIVGNFGDIRAAKNYKIQHLGVDLKAAVGTPVFATNDGVVVFIGKNMPDYGNTIVIDHGLGIYSLYLHLSKFNVKKGQMVTQGQTIALSGATGYVLGPHLHFSIKVRGAALDPLTFIQTTQSMSW